MAAASAASAASEIKYRIPVSSQMELWEVAPQAPHDAASGDLLNTYPKISEIPPGDDQIFLPIGDLHANAKKFIRGLIAYGILELNEDHYKKLCNLYDALDGVDADDEKIDAALDTICGIIDIAKFKLSGEALKRIHLLLIGDEVCDRGANDKLIVKILEKLAEAEVDYTILFSNHGRSALQAIEDYKTKDSRRHQPVSLPFVIVRRNEGSGEITTEKSTRVFHSRLIPRELLYVEDSDDPKLKPYLAQYKSMLGLGRMLANQFIRLKYVPVMKLFDRHWKSHLKLIDYQLVQDADDDFKLTIFTHAPIPFDLIKRLAERKFGIKYDDSSIPKLVSVIEAINQKFKEQLEDGSLHVWDDELDPVYELIWNRPNPDTVDAKYWDGETPSHLQDKIEYIFGHTHEQYPQRQGTLDDDTGKTMYEPDDDEFFRDHKVTEAKYMRAYRLQPLEALEVEPPARLSLEERDEIIDPEIDYDPGFAAGETDELTILFKGGDSSEKRYYEVQELIEDAETSSETLAAILRYFYRHRWLVRLVLDKIYKDIESNPIQETEFARRNLLRAIGELADKHRVIQEELDDRKIQNLKTQIGELASRPRRKGYDECLEALDGAVDDECYELDFMPMWELSEDFLKEFSLEGSTRVGVEKEIAKTIFHLGEVLEKRKMRSLPISQSSDITIRELFKDVGFVSGGAVYEDEFDRGAGYTVTKMLRDSPTGEKISVSKVLKALEEIGIEDLYLRKLALVLLLQSGFALPHIMATPLVLLAGLFLKNDIDFMTVGDKFACEVFYDDARDETFIKSSMVFKEYVSDPSSSKACGVFYLLIKITSEGRVFIEQSKVFLNRASESGKLIGQDMGEGALGFLRRQPGYVKAAKVKVVAGEDVRRQIVGDFYARPEPEQLKSVELTTDSPPPKVAEAIAALTPKERGEVEPKRQYHPPRVSAVGIATSSGQRWQQQISTYENLLKRAPDERKIAFCRSTTEEATIHLGISSEEELKKPPKAYGKLHLTKEHKLPVIDANVNQESIDLLVKAIKIITSSEECPRFTLSASSWKLIDEAGIAEYTQKSFSKNNVRLEMLKDGDYQNVITTGDRTILDDDTRITVLAESECQMQAVGATL